MTANRAHRHRHRSQRAFTLIELLVASAITAVIALGLGEAISLSVRLVGSDGVRGQQVASDSLWAVERQFSTDLSRADCVTTNGGCPSLPSVCAGGVALCVVWCEGGSTRGAGYTVGSGQLVRRDAQGSLVVAREIQSLSLGASMPPVSTSPQLQVNLVAGAQRPQRATFTTRSLITGAAACP